MFGSSVWEDDEHVSGSRADPEDKSVRGRSESPHEVFVVVTSGQAIFFAASAPMVDMFDDIPMRFRDLFVLLVLRTALLVVVSAVLVHASAAVGLI
ncbi:hypothetical protein SAMN04488556_3165 [Halostagnicola kamekurae]|uniref:Uncharacterized protein n=1 Tax=Halostagnicola kamekurae TaxID=619731 RepID=A0A1I6TJJ2_9EURY|nr:hypothetical protein [Halostagnicola kamekurae]SFS89345.1 hypothetical protein SAMN04488556_3165 [Halostagnicola kamekurae]